MKTVTTLLLVAIALAVPMVAEADALDEGRVKELVYEAIRENPDIVMEALSTLQKRQAAAEATNASDFLAAERDVIERDPNAPVLGNPEGDVTVVEFFDYNCPYCRRAKPVLEEVMSEDPGVRIIGREWPILGEGSVFAARAALASREQGLYQPFHWALMGMSGRAERDSVLRVAEEVGLDIERLLADMEAPEVEAHISESMRLANLLGFSGTPSFVIGETLLPGLVDAETMIQAIADVRDPR